MIPPEIKVYSLPEVEALFFRREDLACARWIISSILRERKTKNGDIFRKGSAVISKKILKENFGENAPKVLKKLLKERLVSLLEKGRSKSVVVNGKLEYRGRSSSYTITPRDSLRKIEVEMDELYFSAYNKARRASMKKSAERDFKIADSALHAFKYQKKYLKTCEEVGTQAIAAKTILQTARRLYKKHLWFKARGEKKMLEYLKFQEAQQA